MCTLTVHKDAARISVTMNRDELRSRREDGIGWKVDHGIMRMYPLDAKASGSWIGVNECGVVLCLLNRYEKPARADLSSRGLIIPEALAQGDYKQVSDWIQRTLDPNRYNPFTLIVLSRENSYRFDWDGAQSFIAPLPRSGWYMTTSSSEDAVNVRHYRWELFDDWLLSGASYWGSLPGFHLSHDEGEPSKSPFMRRPNRHTKSITQINVSPAHAELVYYDETSLSGRSWAEDNTPKPAGRRQLDLLRTVSGEAM